GPDGALWFTETTAGQVGRITPRGVVTELSEGLTPASGATGITLGIDGALWLAEADAGQVGRIALSADVSVTKTSGLTTVTPGQTVTYTIVVTNAGPDAVENAALSDL